MGFCNGPYVNPSFHLRDIRSPGSCFCMGGYRGDRAAPSDSRLQEFVHLAECLLFSKTAFHYSAALMISSATSFGNDSIATWLDGTSIAVALAAFTWSLSICGE
jgi:hypothetical protein